MPAACVLNTKVIPQELRGLKQWVCWRLEERNGKPTKVPYMPNGERASATDLATWSSLGACLNAAQPHGFAGVGLVFSADDPYCGVDLDKCRNPDTDAVEPWVQAIIDRLASYTELSQSGTGIHIIIRATLPPGRRRIGHIEMYDQGRFFVMTGNHYAGTPTTIEPRQAQIEALHAELFPPAEPQTRQHGPPMPLSDQELLDKIFAAKNGAAVRRLWEGDTSGYASHSEADCALCAHLAFWTGGDVARVDALFRQSGLYRGKWDEKHGTQTYGQMTIARALEHQREFYDPQRRRNGQHASPAAHRESQASTTHGLPLTSLRDLLNEPDTEQEWLVDGILPAGGFSLLVAKPKAGKSTLARNLALHVAQGQDFLGRIVQQGSVIYLALEEKRSEVKKHFQAMGATGDEPIHVYVASVPADGLEQATEQLRPVLVVIDPLFRFSRVKDTNDYSQVTHALEPLLRLARESGTHVLCVHHAGKGDMRSGGDSILGSTAIFASVDTALLMKRYERDNGGYRTLQSLQRYGEDLPETVLRYDTTSKTVSLGASREREEEDRLGEAISAFLRGQESPVPEAVIDDAVEGRRVIRKRALRCLVERGRVTRTGRGGKGEPYHYSMEENPGSEVPVYSGEPGNQNPKNAIPPCQCSPNSGSRENPVPPQLEKSWGPESR